MIDIKILNGGLEIGQFKLIIYLYGMACVSDNHHLKLPLHLTYCKSSGKGGRKRRRKIYSSTRRNSSALACNSKRKKTVSVVILSTKVSQNSMQVLGKFSSKNLSSLSVPARSKSFGTGEDKNFSESPSYLKHKNH